MRYFLNTSAQRPLTVGGHSFDFELVGLRGGSWLGVLAVEDESAASVLAANMPEEIGEIEFPQYETLKKKLSANTGSSPAWPRPTSTNPSIAVADRVGAPSTPGASDRPIDHNSTANLTAVSLLTTKNAPPVESLLQNSGRKRLPI